MLWWVPPYLNISSRFEPLRAATVRPGDAEGRRD